MFKFKPTNKTYSDPISAIFKPGIPFGREFSKGDICLLHDRIPGSKIFLNSKIFREALLDSSEFLEEILEIKITDTRKKEKPAEEKQAEKPEVVEEKASEPEPSPEPVEEPVKEEVVEESVPAEEDPAIKNILDELQDNPKKKKTTKK